MASHTFDQSLLSIDLARKTIAFDFSSLEVGVEFAVRLEGKLKDYPSQSDYTIFHVKAYRWKWISTIDQVYILGQVTLNFDLDFQESPDAGLLRHFNANLASGKEIPDFVRFDAEKLSF